MIAENGVVTCDRCGEQIAEGEPFDVELDGETVHRGGCPTDEQDGDA